MFMILVSDFLGKSKFAEFEKEVEILSSVNFPFILSFYGATMNSNRLGFIIEYAKNGDLEQFLKRKKDYPFLEKMRMLNEISSAMTAIIQLYLHNNNILHRDLKLKNILVTYKEETKLMDLGLSKMILEDSSAKTRTKKVGTSFFMAPEVINGHYGKPCEVYSFAIVMFIVFTENFSPFGKISSQFMMNNNSKIRPRIKELDIPNQLQEMIERNWNQDPSKRMNFEEISQFLKKYQNVSINHKTKSIEEAWKRIDFLEKKNKDLLNQIKVLKGKLGKSKKPLNKTQRKFNDIY